MQADLRSVHRVAFELRRGAPVLLRGPAATMVLLAAETADAPGLTETLRLGDTQPLLLLARRRADAAMGAPDSEAPRRGVGTFAAYAPYGDWLDADLLRSLADPTTAQLAPETIRPWLEEVALPDSAGAAIQLAKIARLLPAMLVVKLAQEQAPPDLLSVDVAQVQCYPIGISDGLHVVAEAQVPLDSAPDARVIAFRPLDGGLEHLAIIVGNPKLDDAPLVRVHSACLTGDLLGSLRCDCGLQLRSALTRMSEAGSGVLLYLAQEGRGIGIVNKLRAYAIQDRGEDTVDANLSLGWAVDERSFLPAAIMLDQLGVRHVRLLTNNPAKVAALSACGIEVVAREPHVMPPNGVNDAYLRAKADRLGHLLG